MFTSARPCAPLSDATNHFSRVSVHDVVAHAVHLVLPLALRLNEPGLYQLLDVMGDGPFRDGEAVAERLVGALELRADRLEHGEAPRIGECLGDALELAGGEIGRTGFGSHGFITIELLGGEQIQAPVKRCPGLEWPLTTHHPP